MSSLAKQISVPIFSGQNYDYWAIKMKTYFQSQKLWEIVEEGVTLPEDSSTSSSAEKGKLENKKAKDSEALYYIQTAVADHIFPRISVATSAKEAWSILQKEYQGSAKHMRKGEVGEENSLENAFQSKLNMRSQNSNRKEENFKSTMEDKKKQNMRHVVFVKEQTILRRIVTFEENHNVEIARAETGEATWYIDSAASNHMTYNKGAFQTLDESFKTNVKLGDNHIVKVEGKGSVAINTKKTYHKSKLSRELAKPVYKKQHKKPFPSGTSWRAKAVLELIHTDVCGPMRTPSHEQNRYFILFIDDYSQNDLEEGIEHQTTVSYNPQQNGVSERKNRTVMEMARSMLQEKHLPKAFWAEAVYTAVYLLNSICYVHIPTEKRHKLEEKTEKGIFLGYSTQSKGYRIYNLKTKKLIISRDVEFDEDAMWNWDEEKVERQSVMIPKETPPQQQQEEGTDQAEMERRSQQAPGSPRRPPPSEEIEEETPPRRTKLLSDIYETCNFIMLEPENFETL
ncbi:UNVERIFIED_CONTAM: Retrovirus-related Pol polyprotein from transposon TNT 1-94 [Sesamum calycinum]|uniref:Retrovirus-related Pol polyprotein from transposon TNT 1-94 n=1 Tax=Sesamum calycinum TaxID=2727403 RepID=A0AAW2SBL2_9LAMI